MAKPASIDRSDAIGLRGPGRYSFDIVGEASYQRALEDICGGHSSKSASLVVDALLEYEDDNPYDDQAIRVTIQDKTVGYLNRENARAYREQMEQAGQAGATTTCSAKIVGGWTRGDQRGYFGVRLDLPTKRVSHAP